MNKQIELLWRLAVAVEVAEREESTELAQRLRIGFNRRLARRLPSWGSSSNGRSEPATHGRRKG